MTIDDASFRTAMSHFPCGVTIVTTTDDGRPVGLTVSSFCSLSLDPPLVLICIDKDVSSHHAISSSKRYAVNILTEGQEEVSRQFASRAEDKFEGIGIREGLGGVPLIEGSLAIIECSVHEELPGGDHTIFVGKVERLETGEGEPLIYFRSGYRSVK